uniref:Uncharacterized protein n=1 Tax=Anopheles coluzzii TaxID=1518534 RepID=A0A8W7P4S4_ANOCL
MATNQERETDTLPPRSSGEEDPPVISIISRGPLQRLALRGTASAVGDAKPMTLGSVAKVQVVEQNRVLLAKAGQALSHGKKKQIVFQCVQIASCGVRVQRVM